jgi:hypothetical protein
LSVEFDNLMDEDLEQTEGTQYGSLLTDHERKMLSERKFTDLILHQREVDAEIDAKLIEQEEQLRRDEEAFFEAKRQAAQVASKLRIEEQSRRAALAARSWAPADEWEIANGEEDFEQFLENVRVRSLTARTRVVTSQVVHIDTPGSGSDSGKDEATTSHSAGSPLLHAVN